MEVGGENAKNASKRGNEVDINDRDPEEINQHVRVTFVEIIAEPEASTYSFDIIYKISALVFTQTKLWVYRIISAILAIPLMIIWGIYFAVLSFLTIWCCVPANKALYIVLHCVRHVFNIFIGTFMEPFYLAAGKIFYNIRIIRE